MTTTVTQKSTTVQATTTTPVSTTGITKDAKNTYRIFFVDDDPMVLKALSRFFSKDDQNQYAVFSSGESCLKALSQKPDIIILDHNLAGIDSQKGRLDGLVVLRKIKEQSPDTQIIMLSGQDDVQIAVDCLKRGAVNYIVKDAEMQVNVQKAIEKVIKNKELKEEIHELSNTIKLDKIRIRGYSLLAIALFLMLYYFWVS